MFGLPVLIRLGGGEELLQYKSEDNARSASSSPRGEKAIDKWQKEVNQSIDGGNCRLPKPIALTFARLTATDIEYLQPKQEAVRKPCPIPYIILHTPFRACE